MTHSIEHDHANPVDHRTRVIAVMASFWIWCGLLTFPMINAAQDVSEINNTFSSSRTTLICQAAGLALFSMAVCLAYFARIGPTLRNFQLAQLAILLIVFLSVALQLHDEEAATFTGILYTCLLLVAASVLSVLWTLGSDDLERCMSVASVILCSFGISALAILGLPENRNVGDIQPNLFAAPLLAAFIFSQFRAGMQGAAVRIVCFAMVVLVSSRFAIFGCILAILIFELTFRPGWTKFPLLILALVGGLVFWPQIMSVLALDDPTRDLSSGFSGRDNLWYAALAAITKDPFGIGFKRTVFDEAGHNGYLKTLLEFGIPGGGLIIFFVFCNVVMAGIDVAKSAGKTLQQRRFACARFGGLTALVFGAFFQPQMFSLGDAFGMSFLYLLFKPKMDPLSDRAPALGKPASGKIGRPMRLGYMTELVARFNQFART